jgi:glucokinase
MDENFWIGVDIGGTKTAVVLSARPPEMLQRLEFPTLPERGSEQAIGRVVASIHQLLRDQNVDPLKVAGIGISCGGPLNAAAGIIQAPPNLSTWIDVPITHILSSEFRVPCRLENDANAGAVAEHHYGAGAGARNMVFLTLGTGLGAGIIADNRLLQGARGQAGEIGHVRLSSTGPVGYHKVGSVEGWASGGGMAQVATARAEDAICKGEPTALSSVLQQSGRITAKDVAAAARAGDTLALEIVRSTGSRLGEALAILVDILNPERIVIGGLAMRFGDLLLAPARAMLDQEALPESAHACSIVPAALGEAIGDVAAICVAQECGSRRSG